MDEDAHTSDNPEKDPSDFETFLRGILGDEAGDGIVEAMRAQGLDPTMLAGSFPTGNELHAAIGHFRHLMDTTTEPVNWNLAHTVATQQAWASDSPSPSAPKAERARSAMTVADLWLDTVTEMTPGEVTRATWNRRQWIDETLPVWKRVFEPVAANISRALADVFREHSASTDETFPDVPDSIRALLGQTGQMVPKLSAVLFAHQIGNALAALAADSFGSTDVGLPLASEGTTALVLGGIESFADGLDIPFEEVLQYIAVRECAHQRLFHSVPWLAGDLVRAVETYSSQIAIDVDAITTAVHDIDPTNPTSMETALAGGVFSPEPTPAQTRARSHLETLLALIEGWVEVVTTRAVAPYLPHADQLHEMMRRRRASGGPAEQVLEQLVGLKMRPRKARDAARVFELVEADGGPIQRDGLWAHPDVVPTSEELDSPDSFLLLRRAAAEQDAEVDEALERMLDGTLGWAEGLQPENPDATRTDTTPEEDASEEPETPQE